MTTHVQLDLPTGPKVHFSGRSASFFCMEKNSFVPISPTSTGRIGTNSTFTSPHRGRPPGESIGPDPAPPGLGFLRAFLWWPSVGGYHLGWTWTWSHPGFLSRFTPGRLGLSFVPSFLLEHLGPVDADLVVQNNEDSRLCAKVGLFFFYLQVHDGLLPGVPSEVKKKRQVPPDGETCLNTTTTTTSSSSSSTPPPPPPPPPPHHQSSNSSSSSSSLCNLQARVV